MKGFVSNLLSIFIPLFIFVFFFGAAYNTHAQSLSDLPGSNPVQVTMSPEFPRPGQQVTITLRSFAADLERSTISWYIDGVAVQSGIAQSRFTLTAGASGSTQEVDIIVTSPTGAKITRSVSVHPGDVEILWQAKSYTPVFYKGKALSPVQGDIVAVAMPHLVQNGVELKASDLVYAWENNGEKMQAESGYGKNSITLPGGFGTKSIQLKVTVSSRDSRSIGVGRVVINTVTPEVVIYEDSLLYGPVYNKALTNSFTLSSQEIRLNAAPYYFTTYEHHEILPVSFRWRINGLAVDQTSNILTLRRPDRSGTSLISLDAANNSKLFQKGSKNMTINFNAQ